MPVLTPTFGILEWTKDEISEIDIKTRKLLCLSGSFHRNSSVDRLYTPRDKGGRGLTSVFDVFLTRIIALSCHINKMSSINEYMKEVKQHESDRLLRICEELCSSFNIELIEDDPKQMSNKIRKEMKDRHSKSCRSKIQHGFIHRKQSFVEDYNPLLTHSWLNKRNLSSHAEGYITAIQEQEINTKALKKRREEKENPMFNNMCRYCGKAKEDIFHLLASCSHLSASLYLPVRHDEVARVLYNAIIRKEQPSHEYILPIDIWQSENIELWWDKRTNTSPSVKHNKPDLIYWNKKEKKSYVIDICVPLDENIKSNEQVKLDRYMPLTIGLKRLYPEYTYIVIPIVLGATGLITNSLVLYMQEIGFEKKETYSIIEKMQAKALIGSMRIMKAAMTMKS